MPFKSKSQQRFMFAAEARGELPEGTAKRWTHETQDIKGLPEKVKESGWYATAQRRMRDPVGSTLDEVEDPASVLMGPKEEDAAAKQMLLSTPTARFYRRPHQAVGALSGGVIGLAAGGALTNKPVGVVAGGALGALAGGYGFGKIQDANFVAPYMTARRHVRAEMAKSANYKLQGETKFQGLDIAIENKKGSKRYWYDEHGEEKGSTYMHCDYGYIRGTKGTDGDHVDVYLGPDESSDRVFIVNQMKKPDFKEFDEQKVMLGFSSAEEAKKAYLKQYDDPKFFGSMKEMKMSDFRTKVLAKENHGEKIAVSAAWIREKAVSGLAKRNLVLDRGQQSQIARKAVDYARAKGTGEGIDAARNNLRGTLDSFKKMLPNAQKTQRPNAGRSGVDDRTAKAIRYLGGTLAIGTGQLATGGALTSGAMEYSGLENFAERNERRMGRGKSVDFSKAPEPSTFGRRARSVAFPIGTGLVGAGLGGMLGNEFSGRSAAIGAGVGAVGGALLGRYQHRQTQNAIGEQAERIQDLRDRADRVYEQQYLKTAAIPASLLQHGTVGAGLGAVAGGLGGALHAQDGQRGQGALRGALVGAGLGAMGGAGVHAIKAQGAKQLGTLRNAATEAEQFATKAHQHAQDVAHAPFAGSAKSAPAASAPAMAGAKTVTANPRGAQAATAPRPKSELIDTFAEANMTPERYGYKATENFHPRGGRGNDGQLYHPITRAPHESGAFPVAASAPGGPVQLSGKLDVARDQARAAGARATALSGAADTLAGQQGVMNQAIDRAALTGGAVGTGLMGYMAVPRQYGGVGPEAAPKTASGDDRVGRIADRVDDVGIGILASPYVNDLANKGFKNMMMRGGRMGQVGAWGHAATEGLGHVLHHPVTELTGLALVAPGVVHPIAKGIHKVTSPKPAPVPTPGLPAPAVEAAKLAGAVIANDKLAGAARLALGLGAVGAVGAGLYGAKKGIDKAVHMAQPHHAASYPRVLPGMPPPIPVG
jgi:hypothetical protein